jgi:hypothetical protein
MKNIKKYNEFVNENRINNEELNESWRKVKPWLRLPVLLLDLLLGKILNYIPRLNLRYDELAAKIDLGKGLSHNTIPEDSQMKKLTIDDIKNEKMKKSLMLSGIFKSWNIYYMRTIDPEKKSNRNGSDTNRDVIYITKDELSPGDQFTGERISEFEFKKEYDNLNKKSLKKLGIEFNEFYKIMPQMFILAAKITEEHDEMEKERKLSYKNKIQKELEKLVNKTIKEEKFTSRSKSISGHWDNSPVFYKVVKEDRVDLAEKLIDAAKKEGEAEEMVDLLIDYDCWFVDKKYKGNPQYKSPIDYVKSEEMRKLIMDTLEPGSYEKWKQEKEFKKLNI